MDRKTKTLSFKSTDKINQWIESFKEKLSHSGKEVNQSDILRAKIEESLSSNQDYSFGLYEMLKDQKGTLTTIYNKMQSSDTFLDPVEIYFLLYQARQAYVRYPSSVIAIDGVVASLKVCRNMFTCARNASWKPEIGDNYYLNNLRGDKDPSKELYDQLLDLTDQTINKINSHNHYTSGGADLHTRNAEFAIKSLNLSVEDLNKSIEGHIETLFALSVIPYQLQAGREVSFLDMDSMPRDDFPKIEYTSGDITLTVLMSNKRLLGAVRIENNSLTLAMMWKTLYESYRAFTFQACITSEMRLYRDDETLDGMLDHEKSGIRIDLSKDQIDSIGIVLGQFFDDPAMKDHISTAKKLYGYI